MVSCVFSTSASGNCQCGCLSGEREGLHHPVLCPSQWASGHWLLERPSASQCGTDQGQVKTSFLIDSLCQIQPLNIFMRSLILKLTRLIVEMIKQKCWFHRNFYSSTMSLFYAVYEGMGLSLWGTPRPSLSNRCGTTCSTTTRSRRSW